MKKLKKILPKKSGRAGGIISVRHRGGRQKRFLRKVDFKREKDVPGKVVGVEYDPNRNANIALVAYEDGEYNYILSPEGLAEGSKIISSDVAPLTPGNNLSLGKIPVGTPVHNVEITPGKGGQLVKGAGTEAVVHGREEHYVLLKLPSGEIRRFEPQARASIGKLGNAEAAARRTGKAGRARRRGRRPTVRGVAQHPGAHPHGGGEGRSGVGLPYPKTYTGRPAVGRTRKKKKYSDKLIISRRKPGKHQKII